MSNFNPDEEGSWKQQRKHAADLFFRRVTEMHVNLIKWRYTFRDVDQKFREGAIRAAGNMLVGTAFPLIVEAIKGHDPKTDASAHRICNEILYDCNLNAEDKELLCQCGLRDVVDILPAPRQPPPPPYCPPK